MCLFSLTVRDNTMRLGVVVMRERVCMRQEYADSMGIDFFETSAKANYNVEEAFKHLAREIRSTCARVAPRCHVAFQQSCLATATCRRHLAAPRKMSTVPVRLSTTAELP